MKSFVIIQQIRNIKSYRLNTLSLVTVSPFMSFCNLIMILCKSPLNNFSFLLETVYYQLFNLFSYRLTLFTVLVYNPKQISIFFGHVFQWICWTKLYPSISIKDDKSESEKDLKNKRNLIYINNYQRIRSYPNHLRVNDDGRKRYKRRT